MKKGLHVVGLCAVLWTWLSGPVVAQSVDATFAPLALYQTASISAVVQQTNGKYVVGGNFVRVNGTAVSTFARLNADGTLDATFTGAPTTPVPVLDLEPLPNGMILAFGAGSFNAGSQTYPNLVRLTSTGAGDATFNIGTGAAGGTVRVVAAQPDGKVLVGGSFTSFNGVAVPRLVRLNTDGSIDQGFAAGLGAGFSGGEVFALAVDASGNILVGGGFTNFNGTGRRYLLRLLPGGSEDTSYNPPSFNLTSVWALALDPVTGQAVTSGGSGEVARWNTDGTLDNSFSTGSYGYCGGFMTFANNRLAVDAQRRVVLARGCLYTAPTGPIGTGGELLTRFQSNGSVDTQFGTQSQVDGPLNVVVVQADGRLLLGGSFSRYGSLTNANLVRVGNTGAVDATFHPALSSYGDVRSVLLQPDGKLLVGGSFSEVNGQPAANLLRLQPNGLPDPTFGFPSVEDGYVNRLALQPDGKIVLAGTFSSVNGAALPAVARLLASGAVDASFQPAGSPQPQGATALALQADGRILVGSNFGITLGGQRKTLHCLQPNGQLDATFAQNLGTGPNSSISDLAVLPDGRVYVGGGFSRFNTTAAEGVVRLLPNGALDAAFALPAAVTGSRSVDKVLPLANGGALVGGTFSSYGGVARTNLVQLAADGTVDPALNAPLAGFGLPVLFQQPDGKIIAGSRGHHSVGGVNQGALFRLNASGTLDNSFGAGPGLISPSVTGLAVQPDGKLVVTGFFTSVSGQPYVGIVRLTAPNVLRVAANKSLARTQAWPNPVRHVLNLELDAAARPQRVTLLDAAGNTVKQQAATAAMRLDLRHLPAGVYLLRVDYVQGGPVTRRVVVE